MSDERLSQRLYAARRKCAPSAVARAVAEGRITLVEGKIDPELADRQWAEHSRLRADSNPGSAPPQNPDSPSPEPPGDSYNALRIRRERAAMETTEHNLAVARGKVIDAEAASKATFDAWRELRQALERLPRRMAGLVVGLTDVREIEIALDRELKGTLNAFARPTTEALKRMES